MRLYAAIQRLQQVLDATQIAGIETNLRYLRALARHPELLDGQLITKSLTTFRFHSPSVEVLSPGTFSILVDIPGGSATGTSVSGTRPRLPLTVVARSHEGRAPVRGREAFEQIRGRACRHSALDQRVGARGLFVALMLVRALSSNPVLGRLAAALIGTSAMLFWVFRMTPHHDYQLRELLGEPPRASDWGTILGVVAANLGLGPALVELGVSRAFT